jgi:hypothetical protein
MECAALHPVQPATDSPVGQRATRISIMAVVTRDSTQGWQGKGLFGGTTEDRHYSWASRRVPALEKGEWLNIYRMAAKAPISSCQVHALHDSVRGIRYLRSRDQRIAILCANGAPVSFRRGLAACRSFELALNTKGFSRKTITRPYP